MKMTFRWYGAQIDPIPLKYVKQIPGMSGLMGLLDKPSRSMAELKNWGFKSATASFELRHEQLRDIKKSIPCEAIVYGRLPLMIMENCIISNEHGCKAKNLAGTCRASHTLTDRRGERFPGAGISAEAQHYSLLPGVPC